MRALLLAALLLLTAPAARAWVAMEAPPQSTVAWVAQDMVYNGVPMRIQYFHSKYSLPQVLAYYRQRWTDIGWKNYVEYTAGPWRNISRAQGDFFVVVQVRPATGNTAEGYLSQRPLKMSPRPLLGQGVPLPPGSKVANDIQSNDGDRLGRTVLAFCPLSVNASAAYYREYMAKDGWSLVSEGKARNGGRQMVLRKDNQELSVAFAPSGDGTAIGMTIVTR